MKNWWMRSYKWWCYEFLLNHFNSQLALEACGPFSLKSELLLASLQTRRSNRSKTLTNKKMWIGIILAAAALSTCGKNIDCPWQRGMATIGLLFKPRIARSRVGPAEGQQKPEFCRITSKGLTRALPSFLTPPPYKFRNKWSLACLRFVEQSNGEIFVHSER